MDWPKLLVLVRHAQALGNTLGDDDRAKHATANHQFPLTERGREQAAITGQYLKERFGSFNARYTSYYTRARETMALMCPGKTVREDARLAEVQRGIWHTMSKEEIRERFPSEVERSAKEGHYHHRPWGGESCPDVELRIRSFLGMLTERHSGKRVLVVVHGHWYILFERLTEGLSTEEVERRFHGHEIKNASVVVYKNLIKTEHIVPWEGKL